MNLHIKKKWFIWDIRRHRYHLYMLKINNILCEYFIERGKEHLQHMDEIEARIRERLANGEY